MAAENGMPEQEDVRKKALLRLELAGVVTATALAGLWWLDQSDGDGKRAPAQRPAPIVSAPAPTPVQPLGDEPLAAETAFTDETDDTLPSMAMEDGDVAYMPATPPPPPRVSNVPRAVGTASSPRPELAPAPAATTPPAPPPAPSPAPTPAATPAAMPGGGYVVQLGVFANPENARELVERLRRQGVRAHLETRVQVGPFLDRREADKARAELSRLGYTPLLTTVAPTK